MPPTQYQLALDRHVEWQLDGKWHVGHTLLWPNGWPVELYTVGSPTFTLVMPQHDRLPVYVRSGLLRDRPSHATLNRSK